ncbi:MAG: hypothetical protein BA872_04680 [Desulfobacterales bacterium C00003060]|nr:MAG: hypothetical protein BA872_04680 [Desulfobacterales bacterium C00003060]
MIIVSANHNKPGWVEPFEHRWVSFLNPTYKMLQSAVFFKRKGETQQNGRNDDHGPKVLF